MSQGCPWDLKYVLNMAFILGNLMFDKKIQVQRCPFKLGNDKDKFYR